LPGGLVYVKLNVAEQLSKVLKPPQSAVNGPLSASLVKVKGPTVNVPNTRAQIGPV
jgi:hypothetical protein